MLPSDPAQQCAAGAVAVLEQHEVKGVLQSPALLGDPSVLEAAADGSGRHTCGFRAQVTMSAGPGDLPGGQEGPGRSF